MNAIYTKKPQVIVLYLLLLQNKMRSLFNINDPITVIYNAVEIQKGELNLTDKYTEILKAPESYRLLRNPNA